MPPPFARADQIGLDEVLERLERAARRVGRGLRAAADPAAAGRAGPAGGQVGPGLLPLSPARRRLGGRPREAGDPRARSRSRGSTGRPPTRSHRRSCEALARAWDRSASGGRVRALVFASANPMLFCAGADIKAFTTMDEAGGRELLDRMHGLLREMERSPVVTIAAVNAIAFGGGCELAMACDFRIAAAVGELRPARDQPRDHPRLRRHPAPAAAGRRGAGAGDEPDRRPDRRRRGLRARARAPRGPRPRAARRRAGVGAQAGRPGADRGRADQAGVRRPGTSTPGSRPRSRRS